MWEKILVLFKGTLRKIATAALEAAYKTAGEEIRRAIRDDGTLTPEMKVAAQQGATLALEKLATEFKARFE